MNAPLTLTLDASPLRDAMRDFGLLLAELPEAIQDLIPSLIEPGHVGSKLVSVESNKLSASGAGEVLLTLKPSESFLALMAAARAGDLNISVIEKVFGHNSVSVVGVATTNEERPSGESQGSSDGCALNPQGGH